MAFKHHLSHLDQRKTFKQN